MRQMEGGYLSNAAVERSKQRLQRLPYIEKVEVETKPVPGTPDLVDVDFDIKEGLPGQFGGGVGYSESQSFILNGSFVHSNFMGTGNRVAAEINAGQYSKVFSLSHTDPYTTIDGVSRTVSATTASIDQFTSASSDFETETGTLAVDYGWPITEFQSLRIGDSRRSAPICSPIRTERAARRSTGCRTTATPTRSRLTSAMPPIAIRRSTAPSSTRSSSSLGWSFDSRNRSIFADRGARHRLELSYTLPGSDVEYYIASTTTTCSSSRSAAGSRSCGTRRLGYGDALGDTTSLPPYRTFSRAARSRCAATARAGWARRTRSATRTAAT